MYKKQKYLMGFTLQELLVVLTIMVVIIAAALTVYLLCYRSWQEATIQVSLQRDASIATDKLIRGVRASSETRKNGLREAESFTIPVLNDSSIRFVSGVDDKERSFYLDGNQIIYDPNALMSGGEVVAAKDIQSLSFEKLSSRRIRININLKKYLGDKLIDVSLETEVTTRN